MLYHMYSIEIFTKKKEYSESWTPDVTFVSGDWLDATAQSQYILVVVFKNRYAVYVILALFVMLYMWY